MGEAEGATRDAKVRSSRGNATWERLRAPLSGDGVKGLRWLAGCRMQGCVQTRWRRGQKSGTLREGWDDW